MVETISKGNSFGALSSREDEILSFVKQGLSNKEIGLRLSLSDKTIKHYMTNVFHKLHVRNRLEAALLVQENSDGHVQVDEGRSVKAGGGAR